MWRNLFISIQEPSGSARTRGRYGRPGRGGDPGQEYVQPDPSNPGQEYVQPDPSDPGQEYVQPDPSDPGQEYVQPDPSGPSYGGGPYYGGPRLAATVQELPWAGLGGGCCCKHGEEDEEESKAASAHPHSGFVIVRLAADVQSLEYDTLYTLAKGLGLDALRAVLEVELAQRDEAEEDGEPRARGAELESFGFGGERPKQAGPKRPPQWVGPWPPEKAVPKPPSHEDEDPKKPSDGGDFPNGNGSTGEPPGVLRSAPLVDIPALHATCEGHHELRKATLYVIQELEKQAQTTRFRPLHSLTSYWRLDLRPYPDRVEEVVEALNRLREVDVAYRELSVFDSQIERTGAGYHEDQGYLDEAPVGIGARWAWEQISAGASTVPAGESAEAAKVRILDLEQGWIQDHEAFGGERLPDPLYGDNRSVPGAEALGQHGTAVLGQLAASAKLLGAHQGAAFWLASHYKGQGGDPPYPFPRTNGHVAAAIVNALATTRENPEPLSRGDVLLLEVQRGRFPTEIDPADFDAIRLASALGVIVVEAAGNGNYDLDRVRDPADGRTFRRGDSRFVDSGAIFVGASMSALPHDRAPFSNFGSRVDCYAWGEGVTTAGYGDLVSGNDHTTYYTNTFSGTSSAAPVIAGAAALVQTLHRQHAQTPLRPGAMRALLSNPATGVRQGPNVGGHIGVMPDLRRIVGAELNLVPQLYLRKRPGDDGERSGPEEAISSSLDILVSSDPNAGFGSGSGTEHEPAPGDPLQPGTGGRVYVRVCNRGGGVGTGGEIHLFAAPAATLITPEHWRPIGTVDVPDAPQGDTLAVSTGIPWATGGVGPGEPDLPDWPKPDQLHSLLAVLPQEDVEPDWPVLPPGPPYFQWRTYREFLRRRGVAWRNVHRVGASSGDLVLAFHLAGTPDLERAFDVEVIQRLPQGAKVTLAAQPALVAKLHQRQPWLVRVGDTIELPQRRSTRFGRVVLPARYYAPTWLRVQATGDPIGAGHSLAVRQLWRGEEVGRVTWHFSG